MGDRQVMDGMLAVALVLRVVWVAVGLLIVLMLIQQGTTFVYQGF